MIMMTRMVTRASGSESGPRRLPGPQRAGPGNNHYAPGPAAGQVTGSEPEDPGGRTDWHHHSDGAVRVVGTQDSDSPRSETLAARGPTESLARSRSPGHCGP
jgi:hypothetical protein